MEKTIIISVDIISIPNHSKMEMDDITTNTVIYCENSNDVRFLAHKVFYPILTGTEGYDIDYYTLDETEMETESAYLQLQYDESLKFKTPYTITVGNKFQKFVITNDARIAYDACGEFKDLWLYRQEYKNNIHQLRVYRFSWYANSSEVFEDKEYVIQALKDKKYYP